MPLVPLLDVIDDLWGSSAGRFDRRRRSDGIASGVVTADYDVDTASVVLLRASSQGAGELAKSIQIDPLQRNNGELFLNTGYVDSESHPGDYMYMRRLRLQPSDRLFTAKKQVLEGMGFTCGKPVFPSVRRSNADCNCTRISVSARVQDPGEMMAVSFEEDKIVST